MQRARAYHVLTLMLCMATPDLYAQSTQQDPEPMLLSVLRSSDDGKFDISAFLDKANGFVPVFIPITEPAVGYGGALALVFIDKGQGSNEGFERPDISAVGGMKTENGSNGLLLADSRYWQDGSLQSTAALFDASINLRFYGELNANDPETARSYTLDTQGGLAQVKFRLGATKSWLGVGLVLADTQALFDLYPGLPVIPEWQQNIRSAGITTNYTYDTRDNLFTPIRGNYVDVSAALFTQALGSDDDYQRISLTGIHYQPLSETVFLGILGSATFSHGDTPFYMMPAISMRGIPAMSYQGRQVAQLEAELRWKFASRYSAVMFAGSGVANNFFERSNRNPNVTAGGLGIRYELARKYGLHMGLDAAYGPDGIAYYVQFGSAWLRP